MPGPIDNMDDNIGKGPGLPEAGGALRRTTVIRMFVSDNGAAGFFGFSAGAGGGTVRRCGQQAVENLGRKGSMMFYGPGMGLAGSVPFNLFQASFAEGGIPGAGDRQRPGQSTPAGPSATAC